MLYRPLLYRHIGLSLAEPENTQPAGSPPPNKLDSAKGFRGLKFGAPKSDFQGLTLEEDHGDIKLDARKDDNLALGPAKLEAIIYYFFQDKFYAVSLHTADRENTLLLLRIAQTAFGFPDRRPGTEVGAGDQLDQSWQGQVSEAIFTVTQKTDEGSLLIRDNQLGSQVEAQLGKSVHEAADDL